MFWLWIEEEEEGEFPSLSYAFLLPLNSYNILTSFVRKYFLTFFQFGENPFIFVMDKSDIFYFVERSCIKRNWILNNMFVVQSHFANILIRELSWVKRNWILTISPSSKTQTALKYSVLFFCIFCFKWYVTSERNSWSPDLLAFAFFGSGIKVSYLWLWVVRL